MVRKSNIVSVGVGGGGRGQDGGTLLLLQLHVLGLVFWEVRHGAFRWRVACPLFLLLQSLLCCIFLNVLCGRNRENRFKRWAGWSAVKRKIPPERKILLQIYILLDTKKKWIAAGSIFSLGWTFDFLLVLLWPMKVHSSCISVQGINGVWVGQQLGQERLKDVGQIWKTKNKRKHYLFTQGKKLVLSSNLATILVMHQASCLKRCFKPLWMDGVRAS